MMYVVSEILFSPPGPVPTEALTCTVSLADIYSMGGLAGASATIDELSMSALIVLKIPSGYLLPAHETFAC